MKISHYALTQALQSVDQHQECNAGNLITAKRQLRTQLTKFYCPIPETRNLNWAFILILQAEFVRLEGIVNPDGTDGAAVPPIVDSGPPTATTMAQVETWKFNKAVHEDYQMVMSCTREAIVWIFPRGDFLLDQRDSMGNLFQAPIALFNLLWLQFATKAQCDDEKDRADEDLRCEYDPTAPINNYFNQIQDARFRLIKLGENVRASDGVLIRATLSAIKNHTHMNPIWREWRRLEHERANEPPPRRPDYMYVELKQFLNSKINQLQGVEDTTGNGLANAIEEVQEIRHQTELTANGVVANATEIEQLKAELEKVACQSSESGNCSTSTESSTGTCAGTSEH